MTLSSPETSPVSPKSHRPFRDNVFLLLEKTERRTSGGIHLPDDITFSEYGPKVLAARVFAAGPGGFGTNGYMETKKRAYHAVEVKPGERVLIAWDAGEKIIIGDDVKTSTFPQFEPGTELRICRNNEILGVVE